MHENHHVKHLVTLLDLNSEQLRAIVQRAQELKGEVRSGTRRDMFRHRTLAMIFDKSSTRTRVSFETAMSQGGGHAIFMSSASMQLGRGEPVEDTARVISSMVDAIVIRTIDHSVVETFAAYSKVPVINGLTDSFHPCQLLADMQTYAEQRGDIRGRRAAWIGDGNNVCHSWVNAARRFDFQLMVATPPGYEPDSQITDNAGAHVECGNDPYAAAEGADIVVTDAWFGLGQEEEAAQRRSDFEGFCVDADVMGRAQADAVFMHCLPAYRGCEVADEVLEGPQSVVWEQAENRLHAQKALLEFLLL